MKQQVATLFLATFFFTASTASLTAQQFLNSAEQLPVQLAMAGGVPTIKVDALTQTLIDLGKDYKSETKAVKLSRITPHMQQERIEALNVKYSDLRSDVSRQAYQTSYTKKKRGERNLALDISAEGTVFELEASVADSLAATVGDATTVVYDDATQERLNQLDKQFQEESVNIEDSISDPEKQDVMLKEVADKFLDERNKIIAANFGFPSQNKEVAVTSPKTFEYKTPDSNSTPLMPFATLNEVFAEPKQAVSQRLSIIGAP